MTLLDTTPYRGETTQIVQDVFATMLGYETGASGMDNFPVSGTVAATVYFNGSWNGAATLECEAAVAKPILRKVNEHSGAYRLG